MHADRLRDLGDFTTSRRVLPISALAIAIGIFAAYVAAALLKLIGLFTNLFFFQRVDTLLVSPAGHHLGPFVILVPVAGALVIGVLARYGSERIRGHGIPEAIEAILINGSRIEPKVALLKPISAAISIGSGGPFGAEGPIIMTGGAFGSMIAQLFHLSSTERKTLLVAGAAAGMSATFASPVAAVLLAVELLLFEWKPRSLIPVALASGLGGYVFPQALGVGYETIGALLQGDVPRNLILGILLVKSAIWAISLGSGTSGGVLAPLLMMGGALGGIEAMFLPHEGAGFWPLISMGAVLGGTMRSPFTSIVFAFELTHDANVFLPLLVGSVVAHAFTVLTLKRSIPTEKVARRGFHLSREYAVDPLEILFVREVMRSNIVVLPAARALREFQHSLHASRHQSQRLLPVVNAEGRFVGVLTRGDIVQRIEQEGEAVQRRTLGELVRKEAVEAFPNEPLRAVVYRMAEKGITRMPVVEPSSRKFLGLISLTDLLKARARHLEEERRREQVLSLRFFLPGGEVKDEAETPAAP